MVFIVPPLFCAYCLCLSLLHVALLLTTNERTVRRPSIQFYAVIGCLDAPGSKKSGRLRGRLILMTRCAANRG